MAHRVGTRLKSPPQVWGSLGPQVTPPASLPSSSLLATPAKAPSLSQTPGPSGASVKRNLAESFGAPEAKRGPGGPETHKVADITPYTNKYRIKVKVVTMGKARNLNTRNFSGSVLDCVLTDGSGQIKLTAWSKDGQEDVRRMEEALEQGGTYMVTGPSVKPVQNTMYNQTGHHYELTWSRATEVTASVGGEAVQVAYQLVTLAEAAAREPGAVLDTLGWVKEAGTVTTGTSSRTGRDYTKRYVVLADSTGTLGLTLWGEQAKAFTEQGRVVAVRGAKVEQFQSNTSIVLSWGGSYEVEPSVPGVEELKAWGREHGGVQAAGGAGGALQGSLVTLREVQEEVAGGGGESKHLVVARASRINTDTVSYRAHNPEGGRCRKKVQEEASGSGTFSCRCGSRAIPAEATLLRYMVRLCLADCSTHEWAVMFEAEELFGLSAEDLQEVRDKSEEDFMQRVQGLQFEERVWAVTGKMEVYQGESRVKLTVTGCQGVDWEGEAGLPASLWAEVARLESVLGLSHEEEWGVDLSAVTDRLGKH